MKKLLSALLILTMLVSMVCVSSSAAGMHINMNFESMDVFTNQFIAGAFYTGDNLLYGYAEAKALQSIYVTDDDLGIFKNEAYTWLTYDATITLSMADDDLSETERFVNLVYCNDNPKNLGRVEDRIMMSFGYDVAEGLFYFSEGWNNPGADNPAANYMEPVAMELETDSGETFVTLGLSVERGRIRCFCNDQLIFDFVDSADDYAIAKDVNSCFLFWQDGNFVQISNISVADQGYLFPNAPAGDDNGTTAPPATEPGNDQPGNDQPGNDQPGNDQPGNDQPGNDQPGNDQPGDVVNPGQDAGNDQPGDVVDPGTNGGNTNNGNTNNGNTNGGNTNAGNTNNGNTNAGNTNNGNNAQNKPADTNNKKPAGGNATATGDITFVVVAAMVAALGCAVIVRKVSDR